MSRSDCLKDKNGKSNMSSVDSYDDESAARTRPISFDEIMLRRRNKELLENVKEPAMEAWNKSPGVSREKVADHFEGERIYKHDKSSSISREKHGLEEPVNVSSRKKLQSTYLKENDLTRGKDRANYILEAKSSAGLNSIDSISKEKTGKEMSGLKKNERINDNAEYESRIKHPRDSVNKDRQGVHRSKSERNAKRNKHIGDDEKFNEHNLERKHDKDRHDEEKRKKHLHNDSEEMAEKKHYRDSHNKDRHAESKAQYDREVKRKYRNGDEEIQGRNAMRKQDLVKHHNQRIQERKEIQEHVKSRHGESTTKRGLSKSREHEDRRRRRSPSFSPSVPKHTYHDGERKELPMLSLKDSSRKKHSDIDRSRVSTNGSSSHHHRHGGSTSGLGGYSPRKRKSEAAVKTPSPPKHSPEKKKRAGWDLPPVGTDNPSPAFVSSSFQLSNHTTLSKMQNVAAGASVDPAIMKLLPMSFLNDIPTGKNANIDSVQLTQATRPMRRLYLENVPASVSERDVMDYFNNLLHSAGVNHIQQVQPCISCILHKDRGQALVEFLTAEDASAALSFDGNTLFGAIVKIRRPKDYVEVATGEPERSMDATVPISDVVIDSADKIFVGGISNHVSSDMIMEIAGAFGSLKAYHFETLENNGSCAFLEYVDHSVTNKACAALNGLQLGGEVLTVVQAMPDVLPRNNGGKPASYGIPEHAKPLLRKPTQVLKIKNVFAVESILSLSDMEIEEVLEDVRLECARFGTVKSLNMVRDISDKNLNAKSEFEVMDRVDSDEASQDRVFNSKDAEYTFSEKATSPKLKGTTDKEFCSENELEEVKVDDGSSVDTNAEDFDNKRCQEEQSTTNTTVEDADNKSIPSSIIQEGPDYQDTPKDGPELHDKEVPNNTHSDIEENMVSGIVDSKDTVSLLQEGSSERGASAELAGPKKCIDEEDDTHDDAFEQGSVLVEYKRTEACRMAAHCLHGRFFDGRMVTVEYVPLSQYRKRFAK